MTFCRGGRFAFVVFCAFVAFGCGSEAMAGPETAIPVFAEGGNCGQWACEESACGYDTATDPRGACCVEPAPQGQTGDPKPSCDPGGGPPNASCGPEDYGSAQVTSCGACSVEATCCYWIDPAGALHSCY